MEATIVGARPGLPRAVIVDDHGRVRHRRRRHEGRRRSPGAVVPRPDPPCSRTRSGAGWTAGCRRGPRPRSASSSSTSASCCSRSPCWCRRALRRAAADVRRPVQEQLHNATAWLDKMGVSQSDIRRPSPPSAPAPSAASSPDLLRQLFRDGVGLFFSPSLICLRRFDASSFPRQLGAREVKPNRRVAGTSRTDPPLLSVSTVFGLIVAVLGTIARRTRRATPRSPGACQALRPASGYIPNIGFVVGLVRPRSQRCSGAAPTDARGDLGLLRPQRRHPVRHPGPGWSATP